MKMQLSPAWGLIYDPATQGSTSAVLVGSPGAYVSIAAVLPLPDEGGVPVECVKGISLADDSGLKLWGRSYVEQGWLSLIKGAGMPAIPPIELLTNRGGVNARLRVDTGQTGFFDGREAFFFKELSIPASSSVAIRFSIPVDFIAWAVSINVDAGAMRYQAITNPTTPGTYSDDLPVFRRNSMAEAPLYVPKATARYGVTAPLGTVINSRRIVAANATAQQQTVGAVFQERGLPAGDYYLKFTNFGSGTATGDITFLWEERE